MVHILCAYVRVSWLKGLAPFSLYSFQTSALSNVQQKRWVVSVHDRQRDLDPQLSMFANKSTFNCNMPFDDAFSTYVYLAGEGDGNKAASLSFDRFCSGELV